MRMWCPPEWRGNTKLTYPRRNAYESELAQLHRWVSPGDHVVDVGAHYGAYALPMSRIVTAKGLVTALDRSQLEGTRPRAPCTSTGTDPVPPWPGCPMVRPPKSPSRWRGSTT